MTKRCGASSSGTGSQVMSRRSALCAGAAASLALLAPHGAHADEVGGLAGVHADHPAQSWRYEDGLPISPAETESGRSFRSVFEKWGSNGDGGWINSVGDLIPGAIMRGIDVSEWQGNIDWMSVKADDVSFAIIRAAKWAALDSKGRRGIDDRWEQNARGCEQNGIPFGAYIYSYARNVADAREEADCLIDLVRGHKVSYPLYIDLEDSYIAGADLNAIAAAFCERIEAAGHRAGVYANLGWWNTKLTDPVLGSWSRWVAQYNVTCDYTGQKDLWQATSKGSISGISGKVDLNFAYVDLDASYDGQAIWSRVYGQDQLDTMQKISQSGWQSSESVVIATDASFWDALTASSLAGTYGCPILLTKRDSLSWQARDEVVRLGARKAFVCGGPIAIASDIDDELRRAGCQDVVRIYGADQQGTAREIANHVRASGGSDTCIIATDWKFQDALSISPFAFAKRAPIYLCETGSKALSADTLLSIGGFGFKKAIIVGGPVAVSPDVERQLASVGVAQVSRIYGQTEYETSKAIAAWELQQGMTVDQAAVATGVTFYDALAGAALCGKNNSVLTIVSDYNRVCITDFIAQHKGEVSSGYVFGGPIAVSDATWKMLLRSYFA